MGEMLREDEGTPVTSGTDIRKCFFFFEKGKIFLDFSSFFLNKTELSLCFLVLPLLVSLLNTV